MMESPTILERNERIAQIRLARTTGIGPVNFTRFMGLYGTAERSLHALPKRFRHAGRPLPEIPTQSEIEDEIAMLEKQNIRHILRSDNDYPLMLSHIADAPPLLFAKGSVKKLSFASVGIVGARNASTAGAHLAESLATELAAAGIAIISGLARGIDTAAHKGSVNQGLTIAALAGSIDRPYPPENAILQEKIAEKGCLVTEAPPGTYPQARHFPRRNRLIAGLSLGSVIIEAASHSGTLITARLAASYDRMVFAVPGNPLDSRSRGGNQLLRDGAVLVEHAQDILGNLPTELPMPQCAPWLRHTDPDIFGDPASDLFPGHDERNLPEQSFSGRFSGALVQPFIPSQQDNLNQQDSMETNISEWENSGTGNNRAEENVPPLRTPHENKPHHAKSQKPSLTRQTESLQEEEKTPRQKILSHLSSTPVRVDDLLSHCQLPAHLVSQIIGTLELEGEIESLPGGFVALLPSSLK